MNQGLYDYSPIVERPPLSWPGGASVAFYLGVNIEHYQLDKPATSISPVTAGLVPDPMNYGWRDYAPRVGIWRLIELLDSLGVRPSVLLNSDVCRHYPQIIAAGTERGWTWLGHGQTNSRLHTGMEIDDERAYLREMTEAIEAATGTRPRGWLGPALTETLETPRLLAELGYRYVLDWCNDEQPYPLNVEGMISVPYTVDLNDITLLVGHNLSGPDYLRLVFDSLEQLLADGRTSGRVMALAIHPFVINQPSRHRYLAQALERICSTDGVWVTTSDAIAEHYLSQRGAAA
ncbi:MAG: polysaccharide deacetylase family protein [Solirubrobacteraceae bacterium]